MTVQEPVPPAGAPMPAGAAATSGSVLDLLRVATFVLDTRARIVLWSPEAERLFGYPPEEALGRNAGRLLVQPEHWDLVTEWFRLVMGGAAWTGVFPVRHRDGAVVPTDFRYIRLRDVDGELYVLGLAADAETVRRLDTDLAMSHSLLTQSPVGLALFDKNLRWLRVNPALARINGLPAEAMLGRRMPDVLTGIDTGPVQRAVDRVLATGQPLLDQRSVGRTAADPGHDHIWSVSYYRVDDVAGRPIGVAASAVDVSERHRASVEVAEARERLAVIADASARIGTTLDLRQTARELAEVAVPRLADLAAVDVLDAVLGGEPPPPAGAGDAARFRALAVVSAAENDLTGVWDEVGELASYGPDRVVTRAVADRTPVLLPRLGQALLRTVAKDDAAVRALREAGAHSYLAVPLIARGRVLGAVSLYRTRHHPRPFDDQDRALAAELASRAAIGIDNARLYTRERNAALTLQRSLLPQLPAGYRAIELAARYLPATSETEVGGDWFDVLPLDRGRIALVVGDVMGKGVHAAAIMGQLRSTIRALTRLGLPPGELLGHLDATAEHLGESIATCLYTVCDPDEGRLETACAGHPPPVLVTPGGTAELLEISRGAPLGVGTGAFPGQRRDLPDGAMLAMFTDGLVENRRDPIDTGLHTLLRLLRGAGRRPLEQVCDAVLEGLGRAPLDDIALLLARVHRRASGRPARHRRTPRG
ncbi:SpoIIE family protein phosphatase [Streptomyces aidingensis]|uniref:protein-serine/threonine phosphatase n=1 Tax=Streptomyces aidingensis TaxID=910347 RepID=A0A1I1PQX1_9ACTN|nr:SpoIIE family protein phosphatase [Streptomyces aidingensis]SFD08410.1 PAS domain S-box-containing protein [Streptomyces aidingensis]